LPHSCSRVFSKTDYYRHAGECLELHASTQGPIDHQESPAESTRSQESEPGSHQGATAENETVAEGLRGLVLRHGRQAISGVAALFATALWNAQPEEAKVAVAAAAVGRAPPTTAWIEDPSCPEQGSGSDTSDEDYDSADSESSQVCLSQRAHWLLFVQL